MRKTGLEGVCLVRGGRRLRMGYTTGSCAAAAAQAAAWMLLTEKPVPEAELDTPAGVRLYLEVLNPVIRPGFASCAVRKDAGDDPDVTDQALICASAENDAGDGIRIEGGSGVGRVTRPGLDQPVGEAAINRVPREMIRENVDAVRRKLGYPGGLLITIWVPGGEELAKRTFNPKLGITGGISILGTTGLVRPMSGEAVVETVRTEMRMRRAAGDEVLLAVPGHYGQAFLETLPGVDARAAVTCGNYVGKTLDMALEMGFRGVVFAAHIGKFIKVSGGIMNTHSREADARAELLAAHALRAGAGAELALRLLSCASAEEAVGFLQEAGLLEPVMEEVLGRIHLYLQRRVEGAIPTEAVVFSSAQGLLGMTAGAEKLLMECSISKKSEEEEL